MRRAALTIPFLLFWLQAAHTEPSPSVNKLMNTPVSLFHNGLLQLQAKIKKAETSPLESTNAIYDWDENRITIYFVKFYDTLDSETFKKDCKIYMERIRSHGAVFNGKPNAMGRSDYAALFLPPFSYTIPSLGNAGEELDKLINIQFRGTDVAKLQEYNCFGPLLGTDFSVKEPLQ